MTGYLEVLIADNERFVAELASVRLLVDRNIQVVNVYQAMGGGWVDVANASVPIKLATPPVTPEPPKTP